MKYGFFVPNFPISKITKTGEDGWCHKPNHPRSTYKYLDAVLEHIDNEKRIDPIQITIHDENQIYAGPSGVSRLFALINIRKYTHVPAIVSSKVQYDWFGQDVEIIDSVEKLLSYFPENYKPKSYSVDQDGARWHNHRPIADEIDKTMNVSNETKVRLRKMIEIMEK